MAMVTPATAVEMKTPSSRFMEVTPFTVTTKTPNASAKRPAM
jgi:hypothetical protein